MTSALDHHINNALRDLSFTWVEGDRRMVTLPIQYPSGAMVTLEVSGGRHEVYVSDMGLGFVEASTLCTDTHFPRFAALEAKRRGVTYEKDILIARKVNMDLLPAALVAIANASAGAARAAIYHDGERKEEAKKEAIFLKVKLAFPNAQVHRHVNIPGGRAVWDVHNVVDLHDNRKAIFEPVSKHVLSVATKFTMFSDLVARGDLVLNAVFTDPANLDPKAQMLREVANIVGSEDSVEVFRSRVA